MFFQQFGQLITAMVTPFREDLSIDFTALERLVNHLIKSGTTSILITGTTGENPTLSHDEEWELLKKTKEIVAGRVPIIFGAGSNSTKTAVSTSKQAKDLGADGIMSVSPYYNKPNQKGITAHFSAIASEVNLPILLYNNPGRTASSIDAETVAHLNKSFSHICAVKESSGTMDAVSSLRLKAPEVEIYCGDDNLILPSLSLGVKGAVSVTSHVAGEHLKEMIDKFTSGQTKEAAKIHLYLYPLFKALFSSPSPGPAKFLLSKMGICEPYVRLPLTEPAEDVRESLKQVFDNILAVKR
jgi:4-hydroxy-tetrahydrodipicolinate synthase